MTLPLSMILQGAAATPPVGEGSAYAVDLDGTNDQFYTLSDLTGNSGSASFTFVFAFWCNDVTTANQRIYSTGASGNDRFYVENNAGTLRIIGKENTGLTRLDVSIANAFAKDTFYLVQVSVNLANSSQRHVYINDVAQSPTWTTYTNDSIYFTNTSHRIGTDTNGAKPFKGRLSNVFLDYTYRDLSVEANRRYFITADRKPAAGQAALNPIIYLPMDDPATAHVNQGTGGNFTLNGTIARSGRGPNQFNAPYSDLDGSADYLSRTTAPTGIADGKAFTFACCFSSDTGASGMICRFATGVTSIFSIGINSTKTIRVVGRSAGGGSILLDVSFSSDSIVVGRNNVLVVSIDLANTTNRLVTVNGAVVSPTWTTYTNSSLGFNITTTPIYRFGATQTPDDYLNGRLGNVFFDTKYIDLSVPANLAKFVTGTGIDAKPADLGANGELPFGTSPLIYLPMYGNNAGKNYGTGGDFTVNSGPYPGARGPNEFWGNKADFDGGTGYLARASGLTGIAASKTLSLSFWANKDVTSQQTLLHIETSGGAYRLYLDYDNATTTVALKVTNSSGIDVLYVRWSPPIVSSSVSITHSCINVDLSNISNRSVYVDGSPATVTWATYTNDLMDLVNPNVNIGAWQGASQFFNGRLAEFYLTTDYIDFSQEANRLLFRDAFGNPVDLAPQITAGTLPNPAIYLRFAPDNFGKNSGTGGDFVKSGTITDGGQL